jgi:MFS family permease
LPTRTDESATGDAPHTPTTPRGRGLNGRFHLLWAGQTASLIGDQITLLALPMLALSYAAATAFEVGVIAMALRLPYLLIGLQAGVWVTRYGLARSMVAADVVRGAAIAVLPLTLLMNWASLGAIVAVAFTVGVGSVFFQVAYQAFVPEIVDDPRRWHDANMRLSLSESTSLLLGPALGGAVVAWVSIGGALAIDAGSYAISVATLAIITMRLHRGRRAPVSHPADGEPMLRQVLAGLRYVRDRPVLNAIMWTGIAYNLGVAMFESLLVIFAVRDLGLSAGTLGLAIGIGGIGFPVGSLISRHVNRWIGMGPALVAAAVPSVVGILVAGLASGSSPQVYLAAGTGLIGLGQGCFAVNAITLRQQGSEPHMRARTTAVHRFGTWGSLPVGSLFAGIVGEVAGLRVAMIGAFVVAASCFWPLLASPLRRTRSLAAD